MAVLFGDARIAGYVDGDVAVAFGELSLAESAVIDGDVAVIGGATTVQSGARVEGDLAVIGGSLDAPPGFSPRGEQFVMLAEVVQGRFAPMLRWVTEGLLWGRLIVPSIPWVWLPVVVVALFFLAINFVFERPGASMCAGAFEEADNYLLGRRTRRATRRAPLRGPADFHRWLARSPVALVCPVPCLGFRQGWRHSLDWWENPRRRFFGGPADCGTLRRDRPRRALHRIHGARRGHSPLG